MNNWFWFFTWPAEALASTFDAFAQMFRVWQRAAASGATGPSGVESGIDTTGRAGMAGVQVMQTRPGVQDDYRQRGPDGDGSSASRKERSTMNNRDTDLSGEDRLKLVRYKIVFLKRDHEVAFPEKEELVAYDTSAADWAGIKVAHFMDAMRGWAKEDLPEEWEGKSYPPFIDGHYCIPRDDQRYIRVYFEVLQRWDRMEADYEKRRTQAIEDIRNAIAGPRPAKC